MSEYSLDENTNQLRYINEQLSDIKEGLAVLLKIQLVIARAQTIQDRNQAEWYNESLRKIYESLPSYCK